MPISAKEEFQVESMHVSGDPDEVLPMAGTCFFKLKLPPYTTKEALVKKLTYAIYNSTTMELC